MSDSDTLYRETQNGYSSDQETKYQFSQYSQAQTQRDEVTVKSDQPQELQNTIYNLEAKIDYFLHKKQEIIQQNIKQIRQVQLIFNKFLSRLRQQIHQGLPGYWEQLAQISKEIKIDKELIHQEKFRPHFSKNYVKYQPIVERHEKKVEKIEKEYQLYYQKHPVPWIQVNCEYIEKVLDQAVETNEQDKFEEEEVKFFQPIDRESRISDQTIQKPQTMPNLYPNSLRSQRSLSDTYSFKPMNQLQAKNRLSMAPDALPSMMDDELVPSAGTHLIQPCLSEQQFLVFPLKNLLKKKVEPEKKGVQKVGISHYAALIKESTLIITGGEKLTHNRASSQTQTFKRVNKVNHKKEIIRCADLKLARSQHSICSHFISSLLFVTGGAVTDSADQYTKECEVYHWTRNVWERIRPMLKPLAQHASATLGPQTVYTFCGSRGHGISHNVNLVNTVSRYSVARGEWKDIMLDNFYESIPAIGHLTAVELIPNEAIMLFGHGFVKNKGNKTGVILAENEDDRLEVRNSLRDTSKKVPILNGAERPVLIDWKKNYKSGVIWSFSMLPQRSQFTIMKFEFDSDKLENGVWADVGKKEIK